MVARRRCFSQQARREGFEFEEGILTVFERFEVVWPLDIADTIMGPSASDEMTETRDPSS
jgi:hypothetical protein